MQLLPLLMLMLLLMMMMLLLLLSLLLLPLVLQVDKAQLGARHPATVTVPVPHSS